MKRLETFKTGKKALIALIGSKDAKDGPSVVELPTSIGMYRDRRRVVPV